MASYDDWIAVQDAARYLSIPVRTLYRLAQRGQLPATKVGRTWRFKRGLLDAHLALGLTLTLDEERPDLDPPAALPPPPALATAAEAFPATVTESRLLSEVTALADLSIGMSRLLDAVEISTFSCTRLREIFDVDAVCHLGLDKPPSGAFLTPVTLIGSLSVPEGLRLSLTASPTLSRVVATATPIVLDELPHGRAVAGDLVERLGLHSGLLAPVRDEHGVAGILALLSRQRRHFTPLEVERLMAVAGQLGTALSNARLITESRRWIEHLEGIETFSRELNRHRDVGAVADAIARGIDAFVDFDGLRLYLLEPDGETLEAVALRAKADYYATETPDRVRLRLGEGLGGAIARSGVAEIIPDVLRDPRMQDIPGTEDLDESMIVAPLLFEDQVLGVLELSRLGLNGFDVDDLRLLAILSAQASVTLTNARGIAELQRRTDRLERQLSSQRQLLAITERLLKTRQPDAIFEAIADTLAEVVPFDHLTIYLVDQTANQLVPILARDQWAAQILESSLPLGRGITGSVVARGEAELVNDADHDPRVDHVPGTPDDEEESLIVVPLHSPAGVMGALNLYRIGRIFQAEEFDLAKLFANHAAIALENAHVHERLLEAARTDPLTGLRHHGAFQEALRAALADGAPAGVLMIDLDNFKAYNDRYGHQAGDRLLQRLASRFLTGVRTEDVVCRYGGDEFAIVLPGSDEAGARTVAEKILASMAEIPTGARRARVSASIGLACAPGDAHQAADLIAVADTALYVAKQLGKGRVVLASDLPAHVQEVRGLLDRTMEAAATDGIRQHLDPVALVRPLHDMLGRLAPGLAAFGARARDLALLAGPRMGIVGTHLMTLAAASLVSDVGRLAAGQDREAQDGIVAFAHPLVAARLLEPYPPLRGVATIVRHHHERWDGEGYPDGIAREQLSPAVQLLTAINRYLVLVDARHTRRPLSAQEALDTLQEESGTRLSPGAVTAVRESLMEAGAAS